jgi:hypothetical protein
MRRRPGIAQRARGKIDIQRRDFIILFLISLSRLFFDWLLMVLFSSNTYTKKPLHLTKQEKQDLVEFLESLSGDVTWHGKGHEGS